MTRSTTNSWRLCVLAALNIGVFQELLFVGAYIGPAQSVDARAPGLGSV